MRKKEIKSIPVWKVLSANGNQDHYTNHHLTLLVVLEKD
jgi:hypothetical protein